MVVTDVDGDDVVCSVTEGGPLSNNKGISLPGMSVSVPALSGKDIDDLKFARSLGVDLIALSFVRSAADVDLARAVMDEVGAADRPVIAKLESPKRLRISRPPPGLSCRTRGTACARRAAMVGRQALQPISEAWSWQLDTACRGMPSAPFFHPWNERGSVREDRIGQGKHSFAPGAPSSIPAAGTPSRRRRCTGSGVACRMMHGLVLLNRHRRRSRP